MMKDCKREATKTFLTLPHNCLGACTEYRRLEGFRLAQFKSLAPISGSGDNEDSERLLARSDASSCYNLFRTNGSEKDLIALR